MREFEIRLRSAQQVQDFVGLAASKAFTILVSDDFRRVNGKSFTEMLSLNFSNVLRVQSEGYDWEFEQFLAETKRFPVYD